MSTTKYPNRNLPWPICWEGVQLIAQSEGCRLDAYKDIVGVWTIGWGETLNVKEGNKWTQKEADERLCSRLTEFTRQVKEKFTYDTSDYETAAFVSFAYNIGINAFSRSSALKFHNAGEFEKAKAAIKLWNKAGGKVIPGLVQRRAKEAEMYLPEHLPPPIRTGQCPDTDNCERPVPYSSTWQSGALVTASSSLSLAAQMSRDTSEIGNTIAGMPFWLVILLLNIAALIGGGMVMWRIYKRKQEGKT